MRENSITATGSVIAFAGKASAPTAAGKAGRRATAQGSGKSTRGKGAGNGGKGGKRQSVADKASQFTSTPAAILLPRLLFILAVVLLCILGLIMIYSASSIEAYSSDAYNHDALYFLKRQVIWVFLGTIACAVFSAVPYRIYANLKFAGIFWGATILFLLAMACGFGNTSLGATRSISLFGLVDIQPGEFAKVTTLILIAALLQAYRNGELDFSRFVGAVALVLVVTLALIIKQPDLGTCMILMSGLLCLAILTRVPWKFIGLLVLIVVSVFVAVCVIQPYHLERFLGTYLADQDPLDSGYQSVQGYMALANGGWFGVGFGMSRQKYEYLPYAYNDFIYAVIGEELGFVGAAAVVLLFMLFIVAGIVISRKAPDPFGASIAGGLVSMVGWQAILNMACIVGIAPVTGKALPFLSYGGSSLFITMCMVGIVLSVSRNSKVDARNERRRDNLRVMDGGRAASNQRAASQGNSRGVAAALGAAGSAVSGLAGSIGGKLGNRTGSGLPSASSRGTGRSGRTTAEDASGSSRRTQRQRSQNEATTGTRTRSRGNNAYSDDRLSRSGSSGARNSRKPADDASGSSADVPKGRLSYGDAAHRATTVRRNRRPRS